MAIHTKLVFKFRQIKLCQITPEDGIFWKTKKEALIIGPNSERYPGQKIKIWSK